MDPISDPKADLVASMDQARSEAIEKARVVAAYCKGLIDGEMDEYWAVQLTESFQAWFVFGEGEEPEEPAPE